jgi:tetratricopeptide (TPR) repeat protein
MMKTKIFLSCLLFSLFIFTSTIASGIEAQKHFDQAVKLLLSKNYEGAVAEFTKAVELNPKFDRAYTNRGIAWMEMGEYDRAIDDYDKAIELNPKQFQAYGNRGNAWRYKGDFNRAIADHTKAIELNSNEARSYNNRGATWVNKGDFERAIVDFTKAIELEPKYAMPYYNRGNVLYCSVNLKGAIPDYHKALENNYQPRNYPYLMLLITLQKMRMPQKEYEAYQREFRNFVAYNRTYDSIWNISLFYLGNISEEEVLIRAQKGRNEKQIKEGLCEAYYYLGEYRLLKGSKLP